MEEWRDIEGYEGLYQVSSYGRIKSLERSYVVHGWTRTNRERLLKTSAGNHGYSVVVLRKEGKTKHYLLHRIIAIHFIDGFEESLVINHKDGNKCNNSIDNLEWSTIEKNTRHAFATGLISRGLLSLEQYTTDGKYIRSWAAMRDASIELGISSPNILRATRDFYKRQAGGFKWKAVSITESSKVEHTLN